MNAMTPKASHISVCICTFKRPVFLGRLLDRLRDQETGGVFTYSVVVCDNDQQRSADRIVLEFAATCSFRVKYCVEPQQGIALARNRVVQNAGGDYLAFIDDDEFPEQNWLHCLFVACQKYGVSGVLGPVKPSFDEGVPQWIVKGRFYDRAFPASGTILTAQQTRTGNALLKSGIFAEIEGPFRPQFRAGEDVDFFRRAIDRGFVFAWCGEAIVYETVPPSRWKRVYLLRKALLRGASAALRPTVGFLNISKSVVAVPIYVFALPFAALLGQHRFMNLMMRLCDHLGKLLALVGINPIREPYIAG